MIIKTNYKFANKIISYEIFSDGYDIYLNNNPWISQRIPYDKPINKIKTYEENCLEQIKEICENE